MLQNRTLNLLLEFVRTYSAPAAWLFLWLGFCVVGWMSLGNLTLPGASSRQARSTATQPQRQSSAAQPGAEQSGKDQPNENETSRTASSADHDASTSDRPAPDTGAEKTSGPANAAPTSQTNAPAASDYLSEKTPNPTEAEAEKSASKPDSVGIASTDESADKTETSVTERSVPAEKQASPKPPTSRHVARAQLTSGIDDREPVDRITGVFHSNNKPLPRLYYFTELTGLSGETVTHSWWHNGRRIAQISSQVRSNVWRMSSSKRFTLRMAGPWRVVATDSQGNTLSVAKFVYEVP